MSLVYKVDSSLRIAFLFKKEHFNSIMKHITLYLRLNMIVNDLICINFYD